MYNNQLMRLIRHKIKFNRKFPDHRRAVDYQFMMKDRNIFDWARLYWEGFVAMLHKNGPIYLTYLAVLGCFASYMFGFSHIRGDRRTLNEIGQINNTQSARRYSAVRRNFKEAGRYDNITGRFENQPGGNIDIPHQEL